MLTPAPFLSMNSDCDEALSWLERTLSPAGLRVVQTFDLQSARLALKDCPCPHHGTDACDCQMMVLLIYDRSAEPATLVLHGNGGRTWFSLLDRPGRPANSKTAAVLRRRLELEASARDLTWPHF